MLALARQHAVGHRVQHIARVRVTVAHAPAANRNVTDRVEVTTRHSRILSSDRHQVTEQVLRAQKTEAHVRRARPLLQHGRVEVVLGRRPVVQQHDGNLAVLQRYDLRVLGGADDVVVACDRLQAVLAEVRVTVVGRVGEMLPGRPRLAVVAGLFDRPEARARRVAHADVQIGDVEFLCRVDGVLNKWTFMRYD